MAPDTYLVSAMKWVSRRLTKYSSPPTDNTSRLSSSHCHIAPFHQMSQRLFVVVIAIHYWKVVSGCCRIVSYHCHGRGRQGHPSPWWGITNGSGSGDDCGGVERKEDCVCLVPGVQQTNNVCQTTRFCCIPFLCIPQNIPVPIPECPNSARMMKIAGLPAKVHSSGIHRIPQE